VTSRTLRRSAFFIGVGWGRFDWRAEIGMNQNKRAEMFDSRAKIQMNQNKKRKIFDSRAEIQMNQFASGRFFLYNEGTIW